MAISKITTKGILDGTIAEADLADNSVSSAKVKLDILVAEDLANSITTSEIANGTIPQN